MKKHCVYCAGLLILIVCGGIFSKGYPHDVSRKPNASVIGVTQLAIEPLIPGEPKVGSLPAGSPNNPVLAATQYEVQYPGGGATLVLEISPDASVFFFVRRNLPVAMEGDKLVYDFGPSPFSLRKISLPVRPPLDGASYFVAVQNYSSHVTNFTLTATLVEAPTADTVDVPFPPSSPIILDTVELGSISMPERNACALSRTQYTVSLDDSMYCDWGTGWTISLLGDQDLNLYVRKGQRVAVEDGRVVADFESKRPTGNGILSVSSSISPAPATHTYFVAVENCNRNATNYALIFRPRIPEFPPPSITNVFLEKKNLHVTGYFLDPSSTVLFDGEAQKTKYGGRIPSGPPIGQDLLIVKGARTRIGPGESLTISVKISDCTTRPFAFTRSQ